MILRVAQAYRAEFEQMLAEGRKLRRDYYVPERYRAEPQPPGLYEGQLLGRKIKRMDGEWVRDNIDVDFVEGGNPSRYSYVPLDELWVEMSLSPVGQTATLLHEAVECHLMENYQLSYSNAHDIAAFFESRYRQDPNTPLDVATAAAVTEALETLGLV